MPCFPPPPACLQCTDDSNYVGEYQRGKRHGHGVYSFPNGDCYVGQYADDLPHGHGVYHFASGQRYEGNWQQGKKHGWSIYTVDNGAAGCIPIEVEGFEYQGLRAYNARG